MSTTTPNDFNVQPDSVTIPEPDSAPAAIPAIEFDDFNDAEVAPEPAAADSFEEKTPEKESSEALDESEEEVVEAEKVPAAPARKARVFDDQNDFVTAAMMPEEERELNWKKIMAHSRRGDILERPITGVEYDPDNPKILRFITYLYGFKVVIRREDFYSPASLEFLASTVREGQTSAQREKSMSDRMLSANIPFVVTNARRRMDKETGEYVCVVTASREQAMQQKRNRYFFTGNARVKAGDVVKARVLMTTPRAVRMTALGVEVNVPTSELSAYRWVVPSVDFAAGDVLYMQVTNLEVDKEANTVKMELSRRPLELDIAQKNFEQCLEGATYSGKIIGISQRSYFISVDRPQVRGIVPKHALNSPTGLPGSVGDTVRFTPLRKDQEQADGVYRVIGRAVLAKKSLTY